MPAEPAFVDSNVWLYAFIKAQDASKHEVAARLIEQTDSLVLSVQVVNEVAVNLRKKAGASEPFLRSLIIRWFESYEIVTPDRTLLLSASRLRGAYNLSYWDSLIVAAALRAGCAILYTEDLQHGQIFEETLTATDPF